MEESTRHSNRLVGVRSPRSMMALDALYAPVRRHRKSRKEGDSCMDPRSKLLHEIDVRLDLLSTDDLDVVLQVILALRRRA